MKYKCKSCGFIHEGEMPDGYYCPLCGANFSFFDILEKEKIKYSRKYFDTNNPGINRILEKCIDCGTCQKTCKKLNCISDGKTCTSCGQCILTCPTGALTPKYDYKKVLEYIKNPEYIVIALTSPAVRVSLGDAFNLKYGEFLENKMVSALKNIGFDYVFDVTFGADLTSMEEAYELKQNIREGRVMFSSCCPAWISYAYTFHPELKENISTCKSPIGMETSIIKNYYLEEEKIDKSKVILVAVTPCTAKKAEIIEGDCDFCITTSELALLIKESNIDFNSLKDEKFDNINGSSSGTIYGVSSGVTLSVLRVLYHYEINKDLNMDEVSIRKKDFYKEIKVKINDKLIKCASVSTMTDLEKILPLKDEFNFIEVMNCLGGCVYGGGQVLTSQADKDKIIKERSKSLLNKDNNPRVKYPYKNPVIKELYEEFLIKPGSDKAIHYLHTK